MIDVPFAQTGAFEAPRLVDWSPVEPTAEEVGGDADA